jgi:hypothetical protein
MSTRVGHIIKHEDVHGVSGTGKVAEVFEASNGKAILVWLSVTPSVIVFDNVKAVEAAHGHGGKTEIVWEWESDPEPDPMDEVFARKIKEAGGDPLEAAEAAEKAIEDLVEAAPGVIDEDTKAAMQSEMLKSAAKVLQTKAKAVK